VDLLQIDFFLESGHFIEDLVLYLVDFRVGLLDQVTEAVAVLNFSLALGALWVLNRSVCLQIDELQEAFGLNGMQAVFQQDEPGIRFIFIPKKDFENISLIIFASFNSANLRTGFSTEANARVTALHLCLTRLLAGLTIALFKA